MAYAFTVTDGGLVRKAGYEYRTYIIDETDLTTAGVWTISNVPGIGTITLIEHELVVAGTASTTQPTFSTESTVSAAKKEYIGQMAGTVTAAAARRSGTDLRYIAAANAIYGKTNPNTAGGATSNARTRVTVRFGHEN